MCACVCVKLVTIVRGDLKAPFLIATTPRCRGGYYSLFPDWSTYPQSIPYNADYWTMGNQEPFESLV